LLRKGFLYLLVIGQTVLFSKHKWQGVPTQIPYLSTGEVVIKYSSE